MELQSEMADARKKHEVNIKFHDLISCNIYTITKYYLPSNQYTEGPPLTRIQISMFARHHIFTKQIHLAQEFIKVEAQRFV